MHEETEWDFEYRVREAQRDELEEQLGVPLYEVPVGITEGEGEEEGEDEGEEEAVAFARYVDGVSISMRVLGKYRVREAQRDELEEQLGVPLYEVPVGIIFIWRLDRCAQGG
jgi:phosphoglucomutase